MYLTLVNTQYYYYRRVPKALIPYLHYNVIKRSLDANKKTSKVIASTITEAIDKALVLIKLGLDSSLIKDTLSTLTSKGPQVISKPKKIVEVRSNNYTFKDKASEYVSTLSVSDNKLKEYKSMVELLDNILPSYLEDIQYTDLDKVTTVLQHIPKRTKLVYRKMSLDVLVSTQAPIEDRLSIKSINEYIKILKAILSLCYSREYINRDLGLSVKVLKEISVAKDKRDTLSESTTEEVEAKLTTSHTLLFKVLKYTGMRPSELLKAKVTTVDDVLVFDLTEAKLKTASSNRIIPIHSDLVPMIDDIQTIINTTNNMEPLSRAVTKILRELGLGNTSTLYSLRHTFITKLIQKGADNNIVSSLAGHSLEGNSMTMGRYFKGYDVKALQEVIELQ